MSSADVSSADVSGADVSVRIAVDRGLCESHGQCVHTAPEVFDLDDDGVVVHPDEVPGSDRADVEAAAAACPVRAITVG